MIIDYSMNNIFKDADQYVKNDNVIFFMIHNLNEKTFRELLSIKNKIVVLFYIGDYLLDSVLDEILCQSKNYFNDYKKMKAYYIILSVHDVGDFIKSEYNDFFHLIIEPNLVYYWTKIFSYPKINHSAKNKYFLSLNGRADYFRQCLYYFFHKFSLLEKSFFSYIGNTKTAKLNTYEINDLIISKIPWYAKNLNYNKILETIPYTIKNHDYRDPYGQGERFLYDNTFVSIQLETYSIEQFPYFSEKTFRIISNQHPFILHGATNSLALLQDMGFKTFNNWWDESYDYLSEDFRLEAIFYLILEISNWSLEKINSVYKELIPILEYNANHFSNTIPQKYEKKIKEIYSTISEIANNKEKLFQ